MTDSKVIEDILSAAKKATPGPWNIQLIDSDETCWLDGEVGEKPPTIHDLNYIDASDPTTIIAILEEHKRMREALERIASCASVIVGDTVDVAQKALAGSKGDTG